MLQIQQAKTFFTFKKRHVRKVSFVKIKPIWISISFTWFTIYNKYSWNLRELSKYDFVIVFNSAHNSILEQVPVSLVFFVGSQLYTKQRKNELVINIRISFLLTVYINLNAIVEISITAIYTTHNIIQICHWSCSNHARSIDYFGSCNCSKNKVKLTRN